MGDRAGAPPAEGTALLILPMKSILLQSETTPLKAPARAREFLSTSRKDSHAAPPSESERILGSSGPIRPRYQGPVVVDESLRR